MFFCPFGPIIVLPMCFQGSINCYLPSWLLSGVFDHGLSHRQIYLKSMCQILKRAPIKINWYLWIPSKVGCLFTNFWIRHGLQGWAGFKGYIGHCSLIASSVLPPPPPPKGGDATERIEKKKEKNVLLLVWFQSDNLSHEVLPCTLFLDLCLWGWWKWA